MDIIFEQEIPLEKSLILFANYFQFDFGIRLVFHKTSGSGQESWLKTLEIHGQVPCIEFDCPRSAQKPSKREIQLVKSYGLTYKDSMLLIFSIILDHLSAENEANWVRQMISNTEVHGTLIKHIRQFLK